MLFDVTQNSEIFRGPVNNVVQFLTLRGGRIDVISVYCKGIYPKTACLKFAQLLRILLQTLKMFMSDQNEFWNYLEF